MLAWPKSKRLHFIGIGGIGMSGIAEVLLDLGYQVSGSDISHSLVTEKLRTKGALITLGHAAENVEGATLVIYSSAIDQKNPEFAHALDLKIPMIQRAEMLAELMRLKSGIAVAGSHGKTTTTSLVATIFQEANKDATHIIGGIVSNLGGNARHGDGEYLIAEADESDGSFLFLSPTWAVVTNIDNDHLDHYGSKDKIVNAFVEFLNKLPFYGKACLNANDETTLMIKHRLKRPAIWYGVETSTDEADYVAKNISINASGTTFDLFHQGKNISSIRTPLWGQHNVANALAAISLCLELGIDLSLIQSGLMKFKGVGRRLEKIFEDDQFLIIDDYGHHPTEVKATLAALKSVDDRHLCVVFEPHRYTRTQNFWNEFQESFHDADEVYISPIYPASEKEIPGITSQRLVEEMRAKGKDVNYLTSLDLMLDLVEKKKRANCLFVTLGAGAISRKIKEIITKI
jgi:UDP-N-acetylmuramate--alanine ligase